jgi:hypothetical protein
MNKFNLGCFNERKLLPKLCSCHTKEEEVRVIDDCGWIVDMYQYIYLS